MKRILIATVIAATLFAGTIATTASAVNGAPKGSHYNLNIIGVANSKTAEMTDNEGHRIFVNLNGTSKILLQEGADFRVLDANGTDANGAKFQLPNPDPDGDGVTTYSVYARALGKPGGNATMSTCAYDVDGSQWCSVGQLKIERNKKSSFSNVSKQLLFVYADLNGDGVSERMNLFDPALQNYFWNYDNNGLKLLQLRFYPIGTDVN